MEVKIAFDINKTRKITFQEEFPRTTDCCCCGETARLGFVAHEMDNKKEDVYVSNLYPNEPKGKGLWLHDACVVAVYFCKKCLEPTALYNQA